MSLGATSVCGTCGAVYWAADGHACPGPRRASCHLLPDLAGARTRGQCPGCGCEDENYPCSCPCHACGCTPHIPLNRSPEEETHDTPTQGSPCLRLPVLHSGPLRTLHVGRMPVLRHGSSVARTHANESAPGWLEPKALDDHAHHCAAERPINGKRTPPPRQCPSARPGRAVQPPRHHVRGRDHRGQAAGVRGVRHPVLPAPFRSGRVLVLSSPGPA